MARKIVILELLGDSGDYRVAFWLDVAEARRRFFANPDATSVFLDATQDELAAIQSGAVVEMVERFDRPAGTTQVQLRNALIARHAELQDRITNSNRWNRYGSFYDGTTWTAGAPT
jgi:hypothetical protein